MRPLVSFCLGLLCFPTLVAHACTTFAIGRKATADGSVIIGHSDDGDPLGDGRLVYVPAAEHADGALRPIYNTMGEFPRSVSHDRGPGYEPSELTDLVLGQGKVLEPIAHIPEVTHTFAYQDTDYGAINEHNVAIAESTCSSMFRTCQIGTNIGCEPGRTKGEAMMDVGSLSQLALERTKTARDAVQLMGDMAFKYGFFGTQDANGYGEAFQVADHTEVWTFNILADDTGKKAIWAAVRVPDDQMTVLANMFTIREVNVNDTANCLASPNIYSVAKKYGWWEDGQPLDFTEVYSNGEYGNKFYSGRRMWRGLSLAAPSLNLSPDYSDLKYDRHWPWSVKPDKLVTRDDVLRWYRDWYADTPFDTTKGLAAGHGGTPDRFDLTGNVPGNWERTIALFRTNFVIVQQLRETHETRPREAAGVLWFSAGPAHYSPFLPIPSGLGVSLEPLATVYPWKMLRRSLNWACRKVMMTAQIRFDHMHPLVLAKQHEMETLGTRLVEEAALELAWNGDHAAFNQKFVDHAKVVLEAWRDLPDEMFFAFSDNQRISSNPPDAAVPLGYSADWLRAVGLSSGPPLPPPIRAGRCPNWDTSCQQASLSRVAATGWYGAVAFVSIFVTMAAVAARRSSSPLFTHARDDPSAYNQL